jgi:hypothetical protein
MGSCDLLIYGPQIVYNREFFEEEEISYFSIDAVLSLLKLKQEQLLEIMSLKGYFFNV